MNAEITNEDKMLSGAAYAFPVLVAIYIILTDKRKDKFTGFHGSQALFLWIGIVIGWIVLRVFIDLIWSIIYVPFFGPLVTLVGMALWIYALYCGYRAYMGEYFTIPVIGELARGTGGFSE